MLHLQCRHKCFMVYVVSCFILLKLSPLKSLALRFVSSSMQLALRVTKMRTLPTVKIWDSMHFMWQKTRQSRTERFQITPRQLTALPTPDTKESDYCITHVKPILNDYRKLIAYSLTLVLTIQVFPDFCYDCRKSTYCFNTTEIGGKLTWCEFNEIGREPIPLVRTRRKHLGDLGHVFVRLHNNNIQVLKGRMNVFFK